ncbi:MAG: CPBP family glutamic-type intramembrane protease [Bacteroidia bacterium]|nr:CPBP family glutamic-type intramembrane protease [Bacteroidia bacterium]
MDYPLIKPRYYRSLFKDIVDFIRKPQDLEHVEKSTRQKVYDTIGLFILKLAFLIPVSVLIGLIHDPENLTKASMAERFTPMILILVAVIILPTVEEIAFRLSLKFKPIYFALSSGVFCYYLLTKAVYQTKISAVDESFIIRISVALGLVVLLYAILQFAQIKEFLSRFWEKNFAWIYYISCLSFAWIHIFSYELNTMNLLFLPLITLPQLMSGIISGYTRVSFGFQYPLLFHMATNLIAVSISFLPATDVLF